ncbi:DUF6525 family protein [uncultured Sulfitobacter sp.]|uniref:DUF6525 family protein n=1 Tax=uncultured Sulfitobacter sp. TaxID=191468 RepID=UPI00262350FD|nr:DUF6525 family protein [uncultured Sulfitobacter sp.]
MSSRHKRNLGQTSLRGKRRATDPMQTYDALPAPLRQWLGQAALPWSPASARRLWEKAHSKGACVEETLSALSQAEAKTLSRDRFAAPILPTSEPRRNTPCH